MAPVLSLRPDWHHAIEHFLNCWLGQLTKSPNLVMLLTTEGHAGLRVGGFGLDEGTALVLRRTHHPSSCLGSASTCIHGDGRGQNPSCCRRRALPALGRTSTCSMMRIMSPPVRISW